MKTEKIEMLFTMQQQPNSTKLNQTQLKWK